jgi:hypothetical protein
VVTPVLVMVGTTGVKAGTTGWASRMHQPKCTACSVPPLAKHRAVLPALRCTTPACMYCSHAQQGGQLGGSQITCRGVTPT